MRGPEDVVNQARDGATLEQVTIWTVSYTHLTLPTKVTV